MKNFLKNKIKYAPGKIVDGDGKVLGEHSGLPFYTIGQRGVGLGNTGGKALFVVEKKFSANELVVGADGDVRLYSKETMVTTLNWINGQKPKFPLKCQVRLRHRQELQTATITAMDDKKLKIKFAKAQRAVTPGQYAVFYKGGICLGGGEFL